MPHLHELKQKILNALDGGQYPANTTPTQSYPAYHYGPTPAPAPPVPPRPYTNQDGPPAAIPSGASPTSQYAPRVLSIDNDTWVNQKVLLIAGQIGDPSSRPMEGTVWVNHHNGLVAPTAWEVYKSYFKALVYLQPGQNQIRLDFVSQSLSTNAPNSSYLSINYAIPSVPPLDLVIIVARDSPGTYDATPQRIQTEGNGMETAKRKYRMAAYLWQAYTAEQMHRRGFGRRCFQFEEEWQPGSLSIRDAQARTMRNEAKIHVIQSTRSLQEIRDLDVAQQYEQGKRRGDLYSAAIEDIKRYFNMQPGQQRYVSALYLDAHWDPQVKVIRGHAALGGGTTGIQLAIFGSQALHSYPTCLEEVVPAFTDCTPTDTRYVANDCNEAGSNWEAANIGIGAHMHEVGHLFGCPHQEYGVMLRDYVRLNRSFVSQERYSTRTKSQGQLCMPQDECVWHPLDLVRFRFHPSFALPSEQPLHDELAVQVWTVENGAVLIVAPAGISNIEIFPEGDSECHHWIDYASPFSPDVSRGGLPRQLTFLESDLRRRLPPNKQGKKLRLELHTGGNGAGTIDDFSALTHPTAVVRLPNGRPGFRGRKLGLSQMPGSQPSEAIFSQSSPMTCVKMYHGNMVDGVEFMYADRSSQLLGKRGGTPGGTDFVLDTNRGETVAGFYVRSGAWIDGVQIITSTGRRSQVFGNANGGSANNLEPPNGYYVAGISGSCAQWLDGLQLIIARAF